MSNTPIETRPFKQDSHKSASSCVNCFCTADVEALFEIEGMIVVKRYCRHCVRTAEF